MLLNAEQFDFTDSNNYDVVIVGAGAVGLTMAMRLLKFGKKVLLLEAGPEKPSSDSQKNFETAEIIGHELPGLHLGRFRNLGGTTAFWGGQLVPFSEQVFKKREWVSNQEWPIFYEEIEPYYKQVFDILGMSNILIDDSAIWNQLKITPPPTTDTIQPIFTRWAPEPNLAVYCHDEIVNNPNICVLTHAQVAGFEVHNDTITAVQINFKKNTSKKIPVKNLVLACGTVEIARLLLLPDIHNKPAPWSNNKWIGKCFMDHIDCVAGSVHPIDKNKFSNFFDNAFIDGIKYTPKLRLSDQIQNQEKLLEISSHFIFNSSISEEINNFKILIKGLLKGRVNSSIQPLRLIKSLRFIIPMIFRYVRYKRMLNFSDGGIQLRLTSEQSPVYSSSISLKAEKDSYNIPIVAVNWEINPNDLKSIQRFAFLLKEYLEKNKIAEVRLDADLFSNLPSFINKIDDANHQMGGAQMGQTSEDGVVDQNCKVFGTTNLYVAGQAVYPTTGFANPTFTAIALGQRLASYLVNSKKDNTL